MSDDIRVSEPRDEDLDEENVSPEEIEGEQDPSEPDDDTPPGPFDEADEQRDLHDGEADAPEPDTPRPRGPQPARLRKLKIAKGQTSHVFDYRKNTSANGGAIALRACVHHIPVISQHSGHGDLDVLRQVLLAQGLMVQFGTDAEGNVAIYTPPNRLCFHARGSNSFTCGIEHMHRTVGEHWLKKQFRAGAWIAQYLERRFDLPLKMARVESAGSGRAQIVSRGHTSHEMISRKAGFNDRSDPGSGFDYEQVFSAARFFKRHGHFVGA